MLTLCTPPRIPPSTGPDGPDITIDGTITLCNDLNVDPEDDPSVGLINGELAIPGNLLRREVFDPVVNQVSIPQSAALYLGRYERTDMPALIRILRS